MKNGMLSLVLLTGLLAANAEAAETILACWDGTFAYNTFRIEKTQKRLYISIQGSMLNDGEKSFHLWNQDESISLKNWRDRGNIIASFRLDQCQLDEAKKTVACESGDLMSEDWMEAMFLERKRDDLGTSLQLVSKFTVQKLNLQASPQGLILTKSQRYAGTGEVVTQTLAVNKHHVGEEILDLNCGHVGMKIFGKAPEKLIRHLEP